MRMTGVCFVAVPILVATLGLQAQEEKAPAKAAGKKEDKAALYARIAEGPSGVCRPDIEKDGKGRLRSVLVVGKARISTVLGVAKGLEVAQQRAINEAKVKFLQWLKEDVTIRQGQDDETVTLTEGAEEDGKEGVRKEFGKAIEKNTTKFETVSKGLLRGLQVVYYNQDGKDKTYTVVMRWHADVSNAAAGAGAKLNEEPGTAPKGRPAVSEEGPAAAPKTRPADKTIPDKKGVID